MTSPDATAAPLHPALDAWRALAPAGPEAAVETLKQHVDGRRVHRLVPRDGGPPLIAKRCDARGAAVERWVYERVLPATATPAPRFHGAVSEPEGAFCWLFLEEVSGSAYRPHRRSDRERAARWLGGLHTQAASVAAAQRLPGRGPDHYRELLGSLLVALRTRHEQGPRDPSLARGLVGVLRHCERLAERWGALEELCSGTPRTLVHGDFVAHNVFLDAGASAGVMVIDWEKAGWGSPAEDLSSVDRPTYLAAVRECWPGLSAESLSRLALAGRFFRCLVFLAWVLPRLDPEPVLARRDLELCEEWLSGLAEKLGW